MGYPFYFLPDPFTPTPQYDGSSVILQGYVGGSVILQGYGVSSLTYPLTLPAAILGRFTASAINDLVPGGLWYQSAPNSARLNLPYGIMQDVTDTTEEDTRGPSVFTNYMQVAFYAEMGEELALDQIVKAWYATFKPAMTPLSWLGRKMVKFSNVSARVITNEQDAPDDAQGKKIGRASCRERV